VDVGVSADDAMDRLFDLAVVLGDLMNRRLAVHGLTPARAEVIWLLHHGGPRTQRELSQALKCTPRNVTGLVDALQAAGFVARRAHPTDRRATVVSLTRTGAALVAGWRRERDLGASHLIGDTSAAELTTFVTVLDRVLGNLRAAQDRE
jgi:DNA-binding MarR family transcriptional regulator